MDNEVLQMAFRFKGEDYKESACQLQGEGFQPLGFNDLKNSSDG